MTTLIQLFRIAMLALILTSVAVAGDLHDWEIKEWPKNVIASAPGKITRGEMQTFVFFKKDCARVEHLFDVYTHQPNDFTKLKGKVIAFEFNGDKVGGIIRSATKPTWLPGHLLMITFGSYDKDFLLSHLQERNHISIKLVDGNGIIASDYFDVLENEWSTEGIEEAFSKSYDICMQSAPEFTI